jgi:hypothetical protein
LHISDVAHVEQFHVVVEVAEVNRRDHLQRFASREHVPTRRERRHRLVRHVEDGRSVTGQGGSVLPVLGRRDVGEAEEPRDVERVGGSSATP